MYILPKIPRLQNGDYAPCEHSAAQVDTFARMVATADMTSFLTVTAGPSVSYGHPISWECGVTTEFVECTYDLATSYQVHFWSVWYVPANPVVPPCQPHRLVRTIPGPFA